MAELMGLAGMLFGVVTATVVAFALAYLAVAGLFYVTVRVWRRARR